MATATITSLTSALGPGLNGMAPEPPNGDILYEVVDNPIRELPPMSTRETHFASILSRLLGPFAWDHGRGQVEVEMLFSIHPAKNLQRRPDVSFVSFERWPRGKPVPGTSAWEVVPNSAVEVISPTNSANEVIEKLEDDFASGVQRVWVIYPVYPKVHDYDSTTSGRILTRADTLRGAEVLPGFELPLTELFEEEPTEPA
jgi:Uma2 family endonuclease